MVEQLSENKFLSYITWSIFLLFTGLMLFMSILSDWDTWITIYAPVSIVLMSFITFCKRISCKIQSYFFIVAAMGNIFIYSYAQNELYPIILIMCCLFIVTTIYKNTKLLFCLLGLSILVIILHIFWLQSINLADAEEFLRFSIRVFALLFGESFLIILTKRQNDIEAELKVSLEKARQAEHSKSEFLANMSHEIRTPMNAIVGMCELILREDINDEVRENSHNIKSSSRNLLSIINDILDFSKIESGKIELIEDEFDITSVINDVINTANARKEDKNIELVAKIDPHLPKGLIGDEIRIKQIIINLITNAIKFTNEGYVVLKISQTRQDYGINLNVSVTDTGIGISEENLEKLFTSFLRVDTKKNRSVEGTGLGLAISKQLVSKMGGFINVSSVYGEGSTFKFVIPLKVSNPEPFIQIKEDLKIKAALYLDRNKYTHPKLHAEYGMMVGELAQKFRMDIRPFNSAEELSEAVRAEKYTHCFTAQEEYKASRELFNELADYVPLYVMKDQGTQLEFPENIKCVYKPFYALSVAAVLNNQKRIYDVQSKDDAIAYFTAPDAKILIVDDNAINLKVAEGLMKPYNMKIHTAISGSDTLEILKQHRYDIIFMDHMMPEMDGVETTHAIRKMDDEYFKKVPIVALTANAINGVKEMFLQEGFDDFVAKPIELSVLNRTLRKWLPTNLVHTSSPAQVNVSPAALAKEAAITNEQDSTSKETAKDISSSLIQHETGLTYAGYDEETYNKVLSVYVKKGGEYKESLNNRFVNEDWTNYIIEVHALKSSSLIIGAVDLSENAKELEFAGKAGNYELIKEKHGALIAMYEAVLSEASKYLKIE